MINDETLNLSARKFLKRFGVEAQRTIEDAIRGVIRIARITLFIEIRVVLTRISVDRTVIDIVVNTISV